MVFYICHQVEALVDIHQALSEYWYRAEGKIWVDAQISNIKT